MAVKKVEFNREICIGCQSCVGICPENWKVEPDGRVNPIKTDLEQSEEALNEEAAKYCPVKAIKVVEKKE